MGGAGIPIQRFDPLVARKDGSGNLGLNLTPTAGNGLLQLASGTTKANGIAFGTDTFLYRDGANSIKTDGSIRVAGQSNFTYSAGNTLATFSIGTPSGSQQCGIAFSDIATAKWNLYKNTDNSLRLFNQTIDVISFSFAGVITLGEGVNWTLGTATGTKIGTSSTEKLGFFNASPIVRPTLAAAATDAATTQTLANSLRTALINLGLGA